MNHSPFAATIRHNCDISDSRDNGIYSVCTLVLQLRNLYKWENNLNPWEEPDAAILLDWIEEKENYWETISEAPFRNVPVNGGEREPWDLAGINDELRDTNLIYGAGYGLSMKSVFFLAELQETQAAEGCPVFILGREHARELASPFAMLQNGVIYIRREPLRFFFWDNIQDIRASCKLSFHHALRQYGLLRNGLLQIDTLRNRLDEIVDHELPVFIHHEVGEHLQDTLPGATLKKLITAFPGTIYEFVCRAVKDVLADIHPSGMLHFIIREKRESSLGFYTGFLTGLRGLLFPEIIQALPLFIEKKDWGIIENAVECCTTNNQLRARQLREIAEQLDEEPLENLKEQFHEQILRPLGIEAPQACRQYSKVIS